MNKYRKLLSLILAAVCLCGCSGDLFNYASDPAASQSVEDSLTTAPTEMTSEPVYAPLMQANYLGTYTDPDTEKAIDYHMFIPAYATEHMPLIVYLHGIGDYGSAFYERENPVHIKALEIYGESFPFLILAPSSMSNKNWIANKLPYRIKSLIDYISEQYNVDKSKIIITGHSMGSLGVFKQIELFGNFYSCAIPVSMPDVSAIEQEKCLNIPIWGFIGSKEHPNNTKMKELFISLQEQGGNVKFTELEGVDHGKAHYRSYLWDVLEWAISQESGE